MAEDWYGNLGENFDQEVQEQESKAKDYEEKSFSEMDYGVHKVIVKEAYLNLTDSGAKMFEVVYENRDGDTAQVSTYIGNDKGVSTYKDKKTGEDKTLPGIFDIANLCKVVDLNMKELKPVAGKVSHYGQNRDVQIFQQLKDKKLTIALTGEESLGKDGVTVYTNKKISKFMDADGNFDGTNYVEAWEKRIEKRAVRPLPENKKKAASAKDDENKKNVDSW